MNVVEGFTGECVEVWENLRLNPYSNQELLYVSEMGVEARCLHEGIRVGCGFHSP